jgi:hypothetical protein
MKQSQDNTFDYTKAILAAAVAIAAVGLVGIIAVSKTKKHRPLRIADVRAAYEGLSPDEF